MWPNLLLLVLTWSCTSGRVAVIKSRELTDEILARSKNYSHSVSYDECLFLIVFMISIVLSWMRSYVYVTWMGQQDTCLLAGGHNIAWRD